jgi:hypothetical protein
MERKWVAVAATVKDGHYDGWGTEWGYANPPGWRDPRAEHLRAASNLTVV